MKICRICQLKPVNQYSIPSVCWPKCYEEYQRRKQERKKQLINDSKIVIDDRKKIETREISDLVKKRVYERENGQCAICHVNTEDQFHHIFFWVEKKNYGRNNADQLILLCNGCHHRLHFTDETNNLREYCKTYVKDYYENLPYKH